MSHSPVRKLKGQSVVFTGIVRDNGDWVKRARCFELAKEAGAAHTSQELTNGSTLLVQGDLSSRVVSDEKTGYSKKLTTVAEWRKNGSHVHVVDSAGFLALVAGHQALCRELVGTRKQVRIKPEFGDDVFGGLLVPPTGGRAAGSGPLLVDLSGLDAGSRAHQQTLKALIAHLGEVPVRAPRPGAPLFDAGWSVDGKLFIAEVKSLAGANQAQQIRLGLGQVLDYHHQLGAKASIRPVLVLQREPDDPRWHHLCRRHGVALTWGPTFPGV